jgi:glycerate 2-kinase
VRNREALLSHGLRDLRKVVLDVVDAGLAAIDPYLAVHRTVKLEGSRLVVADRIYELAGKNNIYMLGAGKATLRIAEAVAELLGDRLNGGAVIIPRSQKDAAQERAKSLGPIEVLLADHPLPSEASVAGARKLIDVADRVSNGDLVIAAVTGGSSALACLPPAAVSLEEKRELHRLLLSSGATIREINIVRKHVSDIKGGRLAQRARRGTIVNLTVSDVAGDPAEYITDLTVQNTSTADEAIEVLRRYELWNRIAPSIRDHLNHPKEAGLPDLSGIEIQTVMMVTGATACEAMVSCAQGLGFGARVVSTTFEGESRQVGTMLAHLRCDRPVRQCVLVGCGGETTVSLPDDPEIFGKGGPNQETALSAALTLDKTPQVVVACLDTDGSDGGGEVAGALVDSRTAARARDGGLDLEKALDTHRSTAALRALDDVLLTGATLTNVNDMFAIGISRNE